MVRGRDAPHNRAMLKSITLIFLAQLAGEGLVHALAWPVPGPVVGMLLLLAWLLWRGQAPRELEDTADGLLRHLSLLFVPAGVGVVLHLRVFEEQPWALAASIVGATLAVIVLVAWAAQRLLGPAQQP